MIFIEGTSCFERTRRYYDYWIIFFRVKTIIFAETKILGLCTFAQSW